MDETPWISQPWAIQTARHLEDTVLVYQLALE
jgi:hypothetical protein